MFGGLVVNDLKQKEMSKAGVPTRFWECRGQERFGCLEECTKANLQENFPGKVRF